ncbi:MAG: retropepsin-like aspartic protease [Pseudomonadota bacterium]
MLHKLANEGELFIVEVFLPFKKIRREHSVKLVLDTGAAMTIVDTNIINYLGYSARDDGIRRSSLDGAGGKSVGYVIRAPNFRCLNFELTDFEIACHDMNTRLGVAGLLGMNFLKLFRLDIDFNTGQINKIEKSLKGV